jgi:NADPH:quinone reductase-like Zn-dependent oxidoreductase
MRAMTLPAYGPPETLVLREVEAPPLGDEDVQVDVFAASVNAADWHVIRGTPFLARLATGIIRPGFIAPGADVAGRVSAVGERVSGFVVGDEVMADLSGNGFGGFAEQVCGPARVWVKKPAALSFAEAAAVPMAGMTALQGLRDVARIRGGERVLIVGAAGGVGTFAVQIARALGAEVTAACRADKVDLVSGLGAAEVIEGGELDRALRGRALDGRFDVILDCAAYRSPFAFRHAMRRGGRFVLVGGAMGPLLQAALLGPIAGLFSGRRYRTFLQTPDAALLSDVLLLVEQGKLRPLVDRAFPLAELPAALRHVEERRARGKVVIEVRSAC